MTASEGRTTSTSVFPLEDSRITWIAYAGILVVLSVLCFGSLKDHRMDIHDDQTFRDNIALSEDFWYFFAPVEEKQLGSGRPIAELVKWFGYLVWGNNLSWYHSLVVAIHIVCSWLLARTALRLGMDVESSFLGGVLFLTNTAHIRAVQWISGLDYPLALALGLGALLCFARHLDTRRSVWLWCFGVCLTLGVMSHLSSISVVPFCFYWSRSRSIDWQHALCRLAPAAALVGLVAVLLLSTTTKTASTWQAVAFYDNEGFAMFAVGMAKALLWFLGRLLTTAHWYFVPVYEQPVWELFVGFAVLILLVAAARRNSGAGAVWSVWTLLSLVPFLLVGGAQEQTLPFGYVAGPSRYLYSATAGSSLLLALGIVAAIRRAPMEKRILGIVLVSGVLLVSYVSLKRAEAISHYSSGRRYAYTQDFRTAEQQFRLAIEKGPGVIDLEGAYSRLCLIIIDRFDKVDTVLSEALQLFPDSSHLLAYRTAVNRFAEDSTKVAQSQRALDVLKSKNDPEFNVALGSAFHNIGLRFEADSKLGLAIQSFELALEFDRSRLRTLKLLASSLVAGGRAEEAIQIAHQLVRLGPTEVELLHFAADILSDTGRIDDAIALGKRALELETKADLFGLLGYCYAKKGANEDAIAYYRLALEQNTNDTLFRTNLGLILQFQGRIDEAIAAYERVTADTPNSVAQFNLGFIYLAQGRAKEARQTYSQGMERFGAAEAARVGAVSDLKKLVANGVQTALASEFLNTYWPEQ